MPDQNYNTGDGLTPCSPERDPFTGEDVCPNCITACNAGVEWTRLDEDPAASMQMIRWHAPETYALLAQEVEVRALRDAADAVSGKGQSEEMVGLLDQRANAIAVLLDRGTRKGRIR